MIQPRQILDAVCHCYGVPTSALISRRRNIPDAVEARKVYYYLAREVTGCAYHRIGAPLGRKHHSTPLYGHDRVQQNLDRYRGMIAEIQKELAR